MCLNKWDFEDSRAPKRQNFCGRFVCTAKGFMQAVEDNINERTLMNGGDATWLQGIYNRELTGRDGFVMFSISVNIARTSVPESSSGGMTYILRILSSSLSLGSN